MRQGVHDVVDADANAERGILLFSFLADKGRAVYETLTISGDATPKTASPRRGIAEAPGRDVATRACAVNCPDTVLRKRDQFTPVEYRCREFARLGPINALGSWKTLLR